jgi:hypothetical protein
MKQEKAERVLQYRWKSNTKMTMDIVQGTKRKITDEISLIRKSG